MGTITKNIIIYTLIPLLIASIIFIRKYAALKKLVLPALSNSLLREIFTVALVDSTLMQATMKIIKVLANKFYIDYCTIFLYDKRGLSVLASSVINSEHLASIEKYANELFKELKARGSNSKIKNVARGLSKLDYPTAEQRNIKYMNYMLLNVGNSETIGALMVENRSKTRIETFEKEFFDIVLKSIAIVLRTLIFQNRLSELAMTDGLTGLGNRMCMDKSLLEAIQIHKATGSPLSICLLDIDHFKKVNDEYGHAAGDRVLKAIAGYIRENIRDNDHAYRYGGEELLIMFGRTSCKNILNRVDDLRQGIEKLEIRSDTGAIIKVTASFGLAEYPANGYTPDDIVKAADQALYKAKGSGRNRTVIYSSMQKEND